MAAPPQQVMQPPAPSPQALAVAAFLKSQDLKPRDCIFNGQRKHLFKVKRAIRALESDAYKKAQSKNPLLPPVTEPTQALQAFSLLPRSLLALRVSKVEPDAAAKPAKRVKGLWTVRIEQQQEFRPELHYMWMHEQRTWTQTAMAWGLVAALLMVVMFPLWPPVLRLGVWYLSMGMLGLIGLFILMSIFRLILFVVTSVAVPPGLWLYPNLFEDVGFFDSFRPVWAWHKVKKSKKSKKATETPAAPGISAPAGGAPDAKPAPPPVAVSPAPPKPTVEDAD